MAGITVIGGAYVESVAEPHTRRLLGSGLRAAGILRALGTEPVELLTRIDGPTADEFHAVAAGFSVDVQVAERSDPVAFRYPTPIDIPTQSHPSNYNVEPLRSTSDLVVAFGMVDGPWKVQGGSAVVDPQHAPLDRCGLRDSTFERLALILNSAEVARETGSPASPETADELRRQISATVLVVKRGALGAWILDDDGLRYISALRTNSVNPIGSGDAFTAGFAHAWLLQKKDPVSAGNFASRTAAAHSELNDPSLPFDFVESIASAEVIGEPGEVYLAGPFFSAAERWLVDRARDGLQSIGARTFSPLHDIGMGGDEVAAKDLEGLERCSAVLALLDGADPGTLFELGWARKMAIPVVGFSSDPSSARWTMLRGTGCSIGDDLATAIYHASWASFRNEV